MARNGEVGTNKYSMEKRFALVTGASSGMGLEYARSLAAKGHNIIVVSNRDEDNKSVAAMLEKDYGVHAIPYYADLSRFDSAQEIYDWTKSEGVVVDILISNAGLLVFNKLQNTPAKKVELIVGVHCVAPTNLCRLFGTDMVNRAAALSDQRRSAAISRELERAGLPLDNAFAVNAEQPKCSDYAASADQPNGNMQNVDAEHTDNEVMADEVKSKTDEAYAKLSWAAKRRVRRAAKIHKGDGGYVLIMSSLAAYLPYPTISLYSATKAYSKSLGTSLWHEYKDYGINVTTVCPSAVDTPLITLRPSLRKLARGLGVMITPQRLVNSALKALFRGKRLLVPSFVAKLALVFCSILPQHCVNRICHWPVLKRIFDAV